MSDEEKEQYRILSENDRARFDTEKKIVGVYKRKPRIVTNDAPLSEDTREESRAKEG
jgi:hypothetical protein